MVHSVFITEYAATFTSLCGCHSSADKLTAYLAFPELLDCFVEDDGFTNACFARSVTGRIEWNRIPDYWLFRCLGPNQLALRQHETGHLHNLTVSLLHTDSCIKPITNSALSRRIEILFLQIFRIRPGVVHIDPS